LKPKPITDFQTGDVKYSYIYNDKEHIKKFALGSSPSPDKVTQFELNYKPSDPIKNKDGKKH